MGRAIACCALALVPLLGLLLAPLGWGGAGGADLRGEAWIDSAVDARDMADAMFAEARAIWASDGWHVVSTAADVTIESRRIDAGPFARSGVLLTRATAVLANASAEATIGLLTTPEGFAVIDPMSDPKEFAEYLESFSEGWGSGPDARLEVAEAKVPLPPPFLPRDFVVLNAMDVGERLFVSKSVLHRSRPGASEFNDLGVPPPKGKVRALNTFAVSAEDLGGRRCRVRAINFAHLGGGWSTAMMNWINCKAFLGPFFERLQAKMGDLAPTKT